MVTRCVVHYLIYLYILHFFSSRRRSREKYRTHTIKGTLGINRFFINLKNETWAIIISSHSETMHVFLFISYIIISGTDHAGIATQLQVEKLLIAEGTTREEVGRETFLERVWEYKAEQGGHITRQLRSLGASADWSRERFTMDQDLSEAVSEAFVRMHEKGLIYRGEYMVNWAPLLKTAVSDLEVEYTEEEGKLYYFKYMVDGTDGGKFGFTCLEFL